MPETAEFTQRLKLMQIKIKILPISGVNEIYSRQPTKILTAYIRYNFKYGK